MKVARCSSVRFFAIGPTSKTNGRPCDLPLAEYLGSGLRAAGLDLRGFRRHSIGVPEVAQVLRAVPPVNVARQDDLARALAVHLRVVDSWRCHALLAQSLRRVNPATPRADDHTVGGPQVLLVTLVNRAH